MWYWTKREVLEALGKNGRDNKLVDRMIARWEIAKVDWGYEIVERGTSCEVKELKEENEKLKARVKELEEVCKDSLFGDKDTSSDYEELKANYELLHKKFIRMKEWYYMVIAETWRYIKPHYQITKEEYEDQLATAISEKLWREEE